MPWSEAQKTATARWIARIGLERYRELRRQAKARERVKDKQRLLSYGAVEAALHYRLITKPSACEGCQVEAEVYAHHFAGYDEEHWLVIVWLCRPCHDQAHRQMKAAVRRVEGQRQMLAVHPRTAIRR